MIGQGLWKDWNTQEYLEDLIRLTFPAAKVNDIVPFWFESSPTSILEEVANVLYFAKVVANEAITTSVTLPNGSTISPRTEIFHLLKAVTSTEPFFVIGYRITLDNTISNIYSVEEPPVISIIGGRVVNPVYFYSIGDDGVMSNSSGAAALSVGVAVEAPTDSVQLSYPGTSVFDEILTGGYAGFLQNTAAMALPFVSRLRGTKVGSHLLTSNELTQDITGNIQHYNMSNIVYNAPSGVLRFNFHNGEIGSSLLLHLVNEAGAVVDTRTINVVAADFDVDYVVASNPFLDDEFTSHLRVTPTLQGVTCGFYFKHWMVLP